jgi:hypothetical protein
VFDEFGPTKLSLVSIERVGYVKLTTDGDITSRDRLEAEDIILSNWFSGHRGKRITFCSISPGPRESSSRSTQRSIGSQSLIDLLKLRIILNLKHEEKPALQFITSGPEPTYKHRAQNANG